jgi:hypothetical protein
VCTTYHLDSKADRLFGDAQLIEQLKRQHLALLNLDTSKIDHDMEDELEMDDEE